MAALTREITESVQRYPYTGDGEDTQGNQIEEFGDAVEVGIYAFDPGGSKEPGTGGRDAVVTEPTIYLPFGSPFKPHDECEVRGHRYSVEGEPAQWVHPRRGPQGDVVKLRRVNG